jgi:hypothetical protein
MPAAPFSASTFLVALMAFGFVLSAVTLCDTPSTTNASASHGMFGEPILGIRFFSAKSAVAVTPRGILVTDGSLDSWKGVAGWDKRHDWVDLLGGDDSTLYFRTIDYEQIIVKEGGDLAPGMEHDVELQPIRKNGKSYIARNTATYTLWRWTADAGLTALRQLPKSTEDPRQPAACAFASDLSGAFADGEKLMATADGGKTWVENQLEFPSVRSHHHITLLQPVNARMLAACIDSQWVEMLEIDRTGNARQRWKAKLFAEGDYGDLSMVISDPWRNAIWVYAQSRSGRETFLHALKITDGNGIAQFDPFDLRKTEFLRGCSIDKSRLYTCGTTEENGGAVRIWDITQLQPKLISQITVQNNLANLDGAYAAPDSSAVWLLMNHWQLVKWNGQPLLTGTPDEWQGPAVDVRVLDKAEESWLPGKEPTHGEMRDCDAAMKELPLLQRAQLIREMQEKQDQFENHRQQVIWETKRARELKSLAVPAPAS